MEKGPGIILSLDQMSISDAVKFAKKADSIGLTQISVPETWGHDAVTLLAFLAAETNNIELSSGILNIYSRSPTLIAMTAATLQKVSNNRFILGIGLSGPVVISQWHGRNYGKPISRTKDFLKIVKAALNRERMDFDSTELGTFKRFRLAVRDLEKPIPIHIASLGPKNVELTALESDGWIPIVSPTQIIEKQIEEISQIRKSAGLSMDDFHVTPFVNAIFGDSSDKMDLLRRHLHHYFATMGSKKDNFYNKMLSRIGFAEDAAKIIDLFHEGKVAESIKAVSDELIAATCIFGSKDQIQQKISDLLKTGITRPLLGLPLQAKVEHATELLDALTP